MLYIDTLNIVGNTNAIDIHFTDVFINEIMMHFFKDVNESIIFIEVGSLNGVDTLNVKNIYKNSICHCIEGLTANYEKYLTNFKEMYGIHAHNTCIASYDGEIIFHEKDVLEWGIHGIYNRGDQYGQKTHTYNCMKFTTFCNNNNISKIDVMKIDVEGATYDILHDMDETMMLKDVKLLHIETESFPYFSGQHLDNECCSILQNNNFECIMKTGFNPTPEGEQFDSVWINKSFL